MIALVASTRVSSFQTSTQLSRATIPPRNLLITPWNSHQSSSSSSSSMNPGKILAVSFLLTSVSCFHSMTADCESKAKNSPNNNEFPTVYQYKICPFCNRVKAYLDFLNIPYKTIEVNPLTKSELKFSKDYKKVPIVVFPQETLENNSGDDNSTRIINDSKQIIDYITEVYLVKNPESPIDPKKFIPEDTEEWNEWSEKKLAVLLYPNITRSFEESFECFNYSESVEEWNLFERKMVHWVGAFAMSFANKKIKKKYNIVNEREDLLKVLLDWTNAIGDSSFLHGEEISLPDLLVFGVLRSIEGCNTFSDIMKSNEKLSEWYQRVQSQITSHDLNRRA